MADVIDPQRDVNQYLSVTDGLGLRIAYVLETHLHADFISGARELHAGVRKRGGEALTIASSAYAGLEFPHLPLKGGDTLSLRDLTIGVLETPGHSPEHISFTLTPEKASQSEAVFAGGSLIVGGAARTDLLGEDMKEPLAHSLHHTIHNKLLGLISDLTGMLEAAGFYLTGAAMLVSAIIVAIWMIEVAPSKRTLN